MLVAIEEQSLAGEGASMDTTNCSCSVKAVKGTLKAVTKTV